MKALFYYLVQVIITSGILYAYYHFALRNKKFHRYNRFYLLAATFISITIPFLNIPVYFTQSETDSSFVLQTLTVFSSTGPGAPVLAAANETHHINWFTWRNLSYSFYILIASIALLRIIISLIKIRRLAKNNPIEQLDNIHFVNTNEPGTPFSFFRWLFWNRKIELRSEKGEQIFRHELFHIKQKHSWDIMYMELLAVIFWINPFFHLMKKESKAIHEFLADQFAVTENTKWQYAELLLMQVLNTNQQLVNPFFHNQIKRRIAMITTSKKPSYQYLRKLMVFPVAAIVIALFAFSYKQKTNPEASSARSVSSDKIQVADTAKTYPDTVIWIKKTYPSPSKKSPSQEQLNSWQDSKIYGVWFDNHRIKNTELTKFKPSDFVLYNVSKLEKNAVNYGKHYYQVTLLTERQYAKSFPGDSQSYYIRHVVKADTKPVKVTEVNLFDTSFRSGDAEIFGDIAIKEKNGEIIHLKNAVLTWRGFNTKDTGDNKYVVVIDGKEQQVLKSLNEIESLVSPEDIVQINIIKGANAVSKYGAKGEKGVMEILTKKSVKVTEVTLTDTKPGLTDNKIFDKVEIEPSFLGGEAKWRQYLERNLDPSVPVKKKAPDGAYTVIVQFIVDIEGNITDVRALTAHGYGMEAEAIRVIKSGQKWIPAIQNGRQVKAYKRQPITFVVGKGQKNFPSDDEDNFAIIENKTSVFWENGKKFLTLDPSVLYIGVDNTITVACSGIDGKDIIVSVSQGEITGENGKYRIRVVAVSDAIVLQVSSKDGKELGKQVFKSKTIPNL